MGGRKGFLFVFLIFLLFIQVVSAEQGHLKLLAVSENNGNYTGSIADLYLDIKQGAGRVFIETYPVTKLDTQFSTRFAKEIACKYLDKDCSSYDFFYTIKSNSAIVGGPSAGAAISILTISLLGNIKIDDNIATTGTINSGNLIGTVGGIRAKVEAAARNNISKVLVPRGEGKVTENNQSIDIIAMGRELGIEVIEVSDVEEALHHYAGTELEEGPSEIGMNPQYKSIMQNLAMILCNRSLFLEARVSEFNITDHDIIDKEFVEIEKNAFRLREKAKEAYLDNLYYSAASFCYGANVDYELQELKLLQLSDAEFLGIVNVTSTNILKMDSEIDNFTLDTITDLQAYTVVKERIREASAHIESAKELREGNSTDGSLYSLAAAIERLYSAYSWSSFFGKEGKEFMLDRSLIERACTEKINEAEERYQYSTLFFPGLVEGVRTDIEVAIADRNNKDFALCLFKASKAKAKIDIVLSTIGLEKDGVDQLIDQKLKAARKTIQRQIDNEIFPIVGYSYHEYSQSLKDNDKYSSLLYAEYAIELSDISLYLEEKKPENFGFSIRIAPQPRALVALVGGIAIGILSAILIIRKKGSKADHSLKKQKVKQYIRLRK